MTAPIVTVYTKTPCVQCDLTKSWLDNHHIPHTLAQLAEDRHVEFVKALGYLQAPVVLIEFTDDGQEHWSGFRPDKLAEHLDRKADAA